MEASSLRFLLPQLGTTCLCFCSFSTTCTISPSGLLHTWHTLWAAGIQLDNDWCHRLPSMLRTPSLPCLSLFSGRIMETWQRFISELILLLIFLGGSLYRTHHLRSAHIWDEALYPSPQCSHRLCVQGKIVLVLRHQCRWCRSTRQEGPLVMASQQQTARWESVERHFCVDFEIRHSLYVLFR